jgi:hypothetical protein
MIRTSNDALCLVNVTHLRQWLRVSGSHQEACIGGAALLQPIGALRESG